MKAVVAMIFQKTSIYHANFEAAVEFLLPTDPVKKKEKKHASADISGVDVSDISAASKSGKGGGRGVPSKLKDGHGKTGVEFWYYKPKEFSKLTDEQKAELRAYHLKNKGESEGNGNSNKAVTKKTI